MDGRVRVAAAHLAAAGSAGDAPDFVGATAAVVAAAEAGARLLLLPELFAWPFFPLDDPQRWGHVAESVTGETLRWAEAAARRHDLHLVVPFVLARRSERPWNAVASVAPGAAARVVAAKIHLPPAGPGDRFGEPDHFAAGPSEIGVFAAAGVRIAALVCFDRRFPECWRAARAAGADLVVCPVAGPADEDDDYFAAEFRTHARASGVFALSSAMTGEETVAGRRLRHDGDSLAVDAAGRILARRRTGDAPGLVILDFDPAALVEARRAFPNFELRRNPHPAAGL
ncbi:carbon-nitrogen hydrolase family protein [Siculibacillus lacustris]|uniref:Carbon-nitrogen hydrolase family protein n=1 Tax=Siculibacillus lacustris TaxID=1549641 RepID=A0A4Q9VVA9_9HYPH|nr:carbon-nitrogen hydrolase family protein [Siculibacillus lacustris]TBW38968.1 carbon-nitrogen hydrolase family protein [Siculibacillus lacustris]